MSLNGSPSYSTTSDSSRGGTVHPTPDLNLNSLLTTSSLSEGISFDGSMLICPEVPDVSEAAYQSLGAGLVPASPVETFSSPAFLNTGNHHLMYAAAAAAATTPTISTPPGTGRGVGNHPHPPLPPPGDGDGDGANILSSIVTQSVFDQPPGYPGTSTFDTYILDSLFNEASRDYGTDPAHLPHHFRDKNAALESFLSQYNVNVGELRQQSVIVKHKAPPRYPMTVPFIPLPPGLHKRENMPQEGGVPPPPVDRFKRAYAPRTRAPQGSCLDMLLDDGSCDQGDAPVPAKGGGEEKRGEGNRAGVGDSPSSPWSGDTVPSSALVSHRYHNQKFNCNCSIHDAFLDENAFCVIYDKMRETRFINMGVCRAIKSQNIEESTIKERPGTLKKRKRRLPRRRVLRTTDSACVKKRRRVTINEEEFQIVRPVTRYQHTPVAKSYSAQPDICAKLRSRKELVCRTCSLKFRTNKLLAIHLIKYHYSQK